MKNVLIGVLSALLMVCCGSDPKTDESTTDSPATPTETVSEESANKGEVMHQMPTGDQLEEGYEAILEKAGVDDPELMEFYVNFSTSEASPEQDRAHMSVKMVSPANKNKIVQYAYDFQGKGVEGPDEVTLSSGIGASERFIDTYDGFKDGLFKKSDILDFDKAEEVYEAAIAKSGYAPKDCYVYNMQFKNNGEGVKGDVGVQSTRSTTAHKSFYVNADGQITGN